MSRSRANQGSVISVQNRLSALRDYRKFDRVSDRMKAWAVHGVELPFGDEPVSWWIDGSGAIYDRPVADAALLPGGYFLPGPADAHARPAVGSGPAGLVALDETVARANLAAWAQAGITLVRDAGSPGGLTLELRPGPGLSAVQAPGRFLAPAGATFRTCSVRRWMRPGWSAPRWRRSAGERPGSR